MNPTRSLLCKARFTSSHAVFLAERPTGADEDVHMTREVVDHVIEQGSRPGDLVFDPFAGFGTTLSRAVALGRSAVGIELLPERVEHVRKFVPAARIWEGDARELARLYARQMRGVGAGEPGERSEAEASEMSSKCRADLILTSPPYMTQNEHEADPLTGYERDGGNYARYLAELDLVARQCAEVLAPGGVVLWNMADIHYRGVTTPLIADCARLLRRHFSEAHTLEIAWDQLPHDIVRDALIVCS